MIHPSSPQAPMTLPERLRAIRFSSNPDDYDAITIEAAAEIDALTARVAELERQVVDWTVRAGRQVERADAAEAKLEQAALIVEGQSVAVNHLPPSIGGNSLATFLTERDFKAANQIRALQTKDTTP